MASENTRDEPGRDDSVASVRASVQHVLDMVRTEAHEATEAHGPVYHSAHEAYAVLAEEVEEFWAWVMRKRAERIRSAMVKELVQVAAVATKYAAQLIRDQQAAHRRKFINEAVDDFLARGTDAARCHTGAHLESECPGDHGK